MGKGDRRTRRGKLFLGSFGNSRPHKPKKKQAATVSAGSAAPVAKEQKPKGSSRKSKKAE